MSMTPETRSESHDTLPALRKAFERWLNPGLHAGNVSPWVEPGRYEKATHNLAWLAWQAATAQQAAELAQARDLADSEGTRAVAYLRRARNAEKLLREVLDALPGLQAPNCLGSDLYMQVAAAVAPAIRAARQDGAGEQG